MSGPVIELQRNFELLLPQRATAAARLASGHVVVACQGQAPGTILVAPIELPPMALEGQLRARALVQLEGAGAMLMAHHEREEVLALVHDEQGQATGLVCIDCQEARPLWRLTMEPGRALAPTPGPGFTLLVDPPEGLTRLDERGVEVWTAALGAAPVTAALLLPGHEAAVGLASGEVVRVDARGQVTMRHPMEGVPLALGQGPAGRVVAHDGRDVVAFDPDDAEELWRAQAPAPIVGGVAVDGRGAVAVALEGGGVLWLDEEGDEFGLQLEGVEVALLGLDPSGAILGLRHGALAHELLVWPLIEEELPAASPRVLPASAVAVMIQPHILTVLCEGGRLWTLRISV